MEADTEVYGTVGYARVFPREEPSEDYEHCTQPMYTTQVAEFLDAVAEAATASRRRGRRVVMQVVEAAIASTPEARGSSHARVRAFSTAGLDSGGIGSDHAYRAREGEPSVTNVSVTVNGQSRQADVEARTLLVYFLREELGLTGTNVGCDTSTCGSCTVLLDGESVKSCTLLTAQADGREVTTIEAMADGDTLHPIQDAFRRNHGLQGTARRAW